MIRRRDFITLLGGAAAAWPLAARAHQGERVRRLGVLMALAEDDPEGQRYIAAFMGGLRELGWSEGRNIRIDYRWAGSDPGRIRDAAAELIALNPDSILTESGTTVVPLQQMTSTIPIVFLLISDPVGAGFVASLARPGGNITGFSPNEFSTTTKTLELLRNITPQLKNVEVIYNPAQTPQVGMFAAIQAAAPAFSVQVSAASARNADEITHAIEGFAGKPGGGMIVLPNPVTLANRGLIISLMARHHLPAVYAYPFFVREGGLASYGVDPAVQFRQAASYVNRILKGAKPSDLPVQLPTNYETAINLKTAKALGLQIPPTLLTTADEVIE